MQGQTQADLRALASPRRLPCYLARQQGTSSVRLFLLRHIPRRLPILRRSTCPSAMRVVRESRSQARQRSTTTLGTCRVESQIHCQISAVQSTVCRGCFLDALPPGARLPGNCRYHHPLDLKLPAVCEMFQAEPVRSLLIMGNMMGSVADYPYRNSRPGSNSSTNTGCVYSLVAFWPPGRDPEVPCRDLG